MSSHHVVREAQEPALLILNGSALSHAHISPLLEWSPTIIVASEALAEVLEHQIKIDSVVFSRDQKEEIMRMAQEQEPITLVEKQEHESPLAAALRYLAGKGHTAVNILTSGSASEQAEVKNQLADQQHFLNVVLLNELSKSALWRSGKYVKWYLAGEEIEIQAALKEVVISSNGFTTNLQQTLIEKSTVRETIASGVVSINGNAPFWIIEKLN